MLICLDIGNSSTSYGVYRGRRWLHVGHCQTSLIPGIANELIKKCHVVPPVPIAVSSVVPKATDRLLKSVKGAHKGVKVWVVGQNLPVRIKHRYRNINKLGSDRLVNAYGAVRLYHPPLLILDYGTALTCDFISAKGVFEGGLIIPGPELALKALGEKAALLPTIELGGQFPVRGTGLSLLGRDTRAGMKAGILQGYGAMADGLAERFRARFGRGVRVIATGGLAKRIAPYSSQIDLVDPLFTLKGLLFAYLDSFKR